MVVMAALLMGMGLGAVILCVGISIGREMGRNEQYFED